MTMDQSLLHLQAARKPKKSMYLNPCLIYLILDISIQGHTDLKQMARLRDSGKLFISGDESVLHHLPEKDLELIGVTCHPRCWRIMGRQVQAKWLSVGIMAWGALVDFQAFNFLEDEQIKSSVKVSEKKLALQVISACGGLLAVLLACLLLLSLWINSKLTESKEELLLMKAQISVLEHQREEIQNLEFNLQQAKRYKGKHTRVATSLAEVGKSIPANVWLNELSFDKEGEYWIVLLEGIALEEQEVALMLSRLEQLQPVGEVALVYSELVPISRLYKRDKLRDIHVTRFEVVVKLPDSYQPSEAVS